MLFKKAEIHHVSNKIFAMFKWLLELELLQKRLAGLGLNVSVKTPQVSGP